MSPSFVTGCPRTGTTWLFDMIGQHPDVVQATAPELGTGEGFESGIFCSEWRYRDRVGLYNEDQAKEMFARLQERYPEKMLIEKTPWHVYRPKRLYNAYPEARVVLMWREPKAVVSSLLRKFDRMDLVHACNYWIQAQKQLPAWLAKDAMLVTYDELLADPRTKLQEVLDYLDLPRYEVDPGRATRELDCGRTDSWRENLTQEEIETVETYCEPLLRLAA